MLNGVNRRRFLGISAAALGAASTGWSLALPNSSGWNLHLTEQPDSVTAYCGEVDAARLPLSRTGNQWGAAFQGDSIEFLFDGGVAEASLNLYAPVLPMQRLHLRWERSVPEQTVVLGDAWERSYGDLAWLPLTADRPLPWYMLLHHGEATVGAGVKTGPASFAFWQADKEGISLWLDVRNGGNGVVLGKRKLHLATITHYESAPGESAWESAQALCKNMTTGTRRPTTRGTHSTGTIFGSNDWYYAYGQNTADGILRDADLMARLSPKGATHPFTVIDDGYQDVKRFPDMSRLAEEIRKRGVAPGIWIRPLRAPATASEGILLPNARWGSGACGRVALAFDPTTPEGLQAALTVVRQACGWGYELIKHDFSTWELLGLWGREMGASPTRPGWSFHDRTRTNAEIIAAFYHALRVACGEERVIIGCNTVGHLAVGIFDAQRTGDDVSGKLWDRTRRMGVNTLGFRLPQHRSFFTVDADCVPVTTEVPWGKTRQWLSAVAESGTTLLISPQPEAMGAEQREAIQEAFSLCATAHSSAPLDWLTSPTPDHWRGGAGEKRYHWLTADGASPFPV